MFDKRTKNLQVNGEVLELGYFSLKFQQWLTRLWKMPSVYTVYVTQAGTAAPTAEVLNSSISGLSWVRDTIGTYSLKSDAAFIEGKTVPNKDAYYDIDGNYITAEWVDTSTITFKTYAAIDTGVLADDVLDAQLINVEIYNN